MPAGQRAGVLAISLAFILAGVTVASWFARIPAIQTRFDLDDGAMGLLLLCFASGAVIAMPLTGSALARFGGRRIVIACEILLCLALCLPGVAPSVTLLGLSLVLLGAAHGCLDIAMNSVASSMEKSANRPIMSVLHALFSIGGLVGAGLGALLAYAGLAVHWHLTWVAAVFGILLIGAGPGLPRDDAVNGLPPSPHRVPILVLPRRHLSGLAIIAFCALMAEGVTNDWSALFMRQTLQTSEGFAPLGYAVFAVTMITGRLLGGALGARVGIQRLLQACGVIAVVGAVICVLAPTGSTALLGFALLGLGLSAMFPLVISVAGQQPDQSPALSIAAVSSAGYIGLLAGPAVIGGLAALGDLRFALGTLILLGLIVVYLCTRGQLAATAPHPADA